MMSEQLNKVTLVVDKETPCLWLPNMTDEEAARFLMSRAHAIIAHATLPDRQKRAVQALAYSFSEEKMSAKYASLGICRQESDPIHPMSKEFVEHEIKCGDLSDVFRDVAWLQCEINKHPRGLEVLADLRAEAREGYANHIGTFQCDDPIGHLAYCAGDALKRRNE